MLLGFIRRGELAANVNLYLRARECMCVGFHSEYVCCSVCSLESRACRGEEHKGRGGKRRREERGVTGEVGAEEEEQEEEEEEEEMQILLTPEQVYQVSDAWRYIQLL